MVVVYCKRELNYLLMDVVGVHGYIIRYGRWPRITPTILRKALFRISTIFPLYLFARMINYFHNPLIVSD